MFEIICYITAGILVLGLIVDVFYTASRMPQYKRDRKKWEEGEHD